MNPGEQRSKRVALEFAWRRLVPLIAVGSFYEWIGVGFSAVFGYIPFFCLALFVVSVGKATKDVSKATVEEVNERRLFRREGISVLRIERKKRSTTHEASLGLIAEIQTEPLPSIKCSFQ